MGSRLAAKRNALSIQARRAALFPMSCAIRRHRQNRRSCSPISSRIQLADRTKVRGCFALWKRSRHCLSLAFDYQMRADLVVSTIELVEFAVPGTIFHSDQGSQYGALETRTALLRKGFQRSMSRAGTPTDNCYAERV